MFRCYICAIFGFVSNPNEPQTGSELYKLARHLAIEASVRGRDSTGVAVIRQNRRFLDKKAVAPVIYYDKYAERLERLMSDKQFEYFIGHDRFATCAQISNQCAHPFSDKRYVVVHNGYYYNEAEIKRTFGIDNPTGVDSELILSFVAKFGVHRLNLFLEVAEGPSAIAVHDRETQKLFLIRDTNPTSFTHHNGNLVFASTESILVDAIEAATGIKPPAASVMSTLPYILYSCHFNGANLERAAEWTYLSSMKSYSRGGYGYGGYGDYSDYYEGYEHVRAAKPRNGNFVKEIKESVNKSAEDSAQVFAQDASIVDVVEELDNPKFNTLRKCECCGETMDYLYEEVWYCMVCTLTIDDNEDEKFFIGEDGKKVDYYTSEEAMEDDAVTDEKDLRRIEFCKDHYYWEDAHGAVVRVSSPTEVINDPTDDEVMQFMTLAESGNHHG